MVSLYCITSNRLPRSLTRARTAASFQHRTAEYTILARTRCGGVLWWTRSVENWRDIRYPSGRYRSSGSPGHSLAHPPSTHPHLLKILIYMLPDRQTLQRVSDAPAYIEMEAKSLKSMTIKTKSNTPSAQNSYIYCVSEEVVTPFYIVTYYIKWGNYFLDTR